MDRNHLYGSSVTIRVLHMWERKAEKSGPEGWHWCKKGLMLGCCWLRTWQGSINWRRQMASRSWKRQEIGFSPSTCRKEHSPTCTLISAQWHAFRLWPQNCKIKKKKKTCVVLSLQVGGNVTAAIENQCRKSKGKPVHVFLLHVRFAMLWFPVFFQGKLKAKKQHHKAL